MIPIREFTTNVMNKKDYYTPQLNAAGYYVHKPSSNHNWQEMHEFCQSNFGQEHYTWVGSNFWFETEKDRNWFILRFE